MTTAKPTTSNATPRTSERLASLDQFRGYTVAGMFLVNYFGGYAVCPQILRHTHDYCSYADTIMPQFLFAVGFALRLTFGRRMQTQGNAAAYMRMVRRLFGLALVSLVVYNVSPRAATWQQLSEMGFWDAIREPLKRGWFQTLMHIAVTSLWLLPVIHCKPSIRLIWMVTSAILHVILSYWFNYTWVNTAPNGIDGGPLGFLTWTIPAVVGTLACDVFVQPREKLQLFSMSLFKVLVASIFLMTLGWVISCGTRFYDVPADQVESRRSEKLDPNPVIPPQSRIDAKLAEGNLASLMAEPPFVPPPDQANRKWIYSMMSPRADSEGLAEKRQANRKWNYWMMSQRGGTLSYLTFTAGFSLAVYLVFYIASDLWGWQLAFFRTFGTNALVAYVLHMMVSSAVQPFFPEDSPAWYAITGLFLFFAITWLFVRHLEKQGLYLRA